jgi:hypothetical protein
VLAGALPARAQVSPGPLSRPHAHLEGNRNCLECHGSNREKGPGAGGGGGIDASCRACHGEIDALVEARRGLHGQESAGGCAGCHPEHGGADFALIEWKGKPESFDHARAGFRLEGKHAKLACRECHEVARFQVSPVLARRPKGGAGTTGPRYVGLEPSCTSCHEDIHKGALGKDCRSCHGADSFKVPAFDHTKSRYALTGRHATVPCAKCHMAAGLDLPRAADGERRPLYRPLRFDECSACHRDPHAGRLGAACSKCHVTEDFRRVNREAFDHERTRYPLRGRHATVACARCHDPKGAGFNAKPAFARCADCHADVHGGQATLAGKPADCAQCHGLDGFVPASFTVEQHDLSRYPLEGKHRAVVCKACHVRLTAAGAEKTLGPARVVMRPRAALCADCHKDAHGGQLASRADRGECAACHTVAGFKPARYGVAEHARTRLPLDGAHAKAECASCHGPARRALPALPGPETLGTAKVALHPGAACTDCHLDPHGKRYAAAGGVPGRTCGECHTADTFVPSTVNEKRHSSYEMGIRGGHRAVPCAGCHKVLAANGSPRAVAARPFLLLSTGVRALPFDEHRTRCEDCHRDPHGGQFAARADRGRCDACHGEDTFRPATKFDHDRDTSFRLAGAHVRVACAACHKPDAERGGTKVVRYRPTPRACITCHGTAVKRPE